MLDLLLLLWHVTFGLAGALPGPDEEVREGTHFRLVCHFANGEAADQAIAAVEATWPRAGELYDLEALEGHELLSVHLYRDAQSYEAAEQALTQGAFRRNLAFAHHATMSAHVALQPPLSDEALAQVGLPAQTLRLLAHEAAHLVRYACMRNSRSHPRWVADGSASWIDEAVSRDLGLVDELEQDPGYSTMLLRVRKLFERDALPTSEQILRDQLDELGFYEGYAVRWLYFRYLKEGKHSAEFRPMLAELRRLGGGSDFAARLFEQIEKSLGKRKLASIDKGFRKYVSTLEPAWDQVFRALHFKDDAWVQAAFDKNAIAWRRTPSGKNYTIAGELTILPGPRGQMNVFLGRSEQGFYSVAFSAGAGVTLFEFLSASDDWQRRGFAECEDLGPGEAFSFSVHVKGDEVQVSVNDRAVLSGEAQTLNLEGPWGLSAQARSAGTWKLDRAPGL